MAAPRTEPLSEVERVRHLLNRFSLGTTPTLEAQVRELGPLRWFERQLERTTEESIEASPALARGLARLPSTTLTSREIVDTYQAEGGDRSAPVRELRERILLFAVHGAPLREVAADFFRNHFCISIEKGPVRYYATEFERDVIHGRVFGEFLDMLRASTRHPAMLLYLDNVVSRRAPTKAELKKIEMRVRLETRSKKDGLTASNIAAQRGLNENFARELLELHTLGVDNGYDQADVEDVARAFTGWTIRRKEGEPIEFLFRPEMHEKGRKKLLHHVIQDDWKTPENEGEEMLRLLAAEDGTADHMARKLCRHFVHDDPSPGMLKRVAKAFRRADGHLPDVYRAIVQDEEFFAPQHYRAKYKRPFELVVSALRATGATIEHSADLVDSLRDMDEALMACKDPTGYYDQAEAWLDPGAMAVRWAFCLRLATGRLEGVRIPDEFFAELDPKEPGRWTQQLAARLVPDGLEPRVATELEALVERSVQHARPRRGQLAAGELMRTLTGALLGSAEFQRQ